MKIIQSPATPGVRSHRSRSGGRRARSAGTVGLLTAAVLGVIGLANGVAQTPAAGGPPTVPAPPAPQASDLTAADVNAWLDGFLPYALKSGDIAGADVAIVKDGAILTERGFGYADIDKQKPVDPQLTLFRPGSVSKLLTWTAVMQLVEQKKIDLDADVNQYLDFHIPERGGKPVTMRNLMQHTAGFEEQAKGIIFEGDKAPGYDTLLKAAVPHRVFDAGTTPAYSNYGASLAGYIVQRLSGESFDEYIEHHIFAPLDMKHSTFRQPLPANLAPLMSQGYRTASDDKPRPFEIVGPAPAGSLSAAAEDMAHFMIAHLQNGEYQGRRILSAETAEQMHNSPLTLLPPLNRMELGFFETNINGREVIAHLGDTDYFHTSLHLFLKENVGLYISFNSPGKEGAAGGLRGAVFQDFADRYFPAPPTEARVDPKTAAADAALMSGTWIVSRRSVSGFLAALGIVEQISVAADKEGRLVLPFPGLNGKPRHWVETGRFVWQDTTGHDRAAAAIVDGKPVRFSFDMLSPFMVFERVPWYANSAWLRPLLYASLVALLLTVVFWPVTAIVRRSYGGALALPAPALRAYRQSKIAALLDIVALGLWLLIFSLMLQDTSYLNGSLDPLLWFAELFGTVCFIAALVLTVLNLRAVWSGVRRWPAKLWSVVLVIATLTVLWFALVFKLMSFGVTY
jgi:CubicO group peptidase (beta-lactamase class C family)